MLNRLNCLNERDNDTGTCMTNQSLDRLHSVPLKHTDPFPFLNSQNSGFFLRRGQSVMYKADGVCPRASLNASTIPLIA